MLLSPLRWYARRTGMPRDVLILAAVAFCVALGFGVLMPVLPIVARQFGVSAFMVSWVVSSFALMRLIMAPACGRLIDWLGERVTIFCAIGFVALTSVLAGLAVEFWQLLMFRALSGLGSALFTVSSMTLLLKSAPATIRGRASGFYQGGFLLGSMAGPAVGGLVAAISTRAPFFFYAASLVVAGFICLIFLDKKERGGPLTKSGSGLRLGQVIRDVRYQAAVFSGFANGWGTMGVRNTFVPLLVTEVLHLAPTWTGYLFAVASITQALMLGPAGRWTDTVGRRPVLVTSGLIAALTIVVTPFAPNVWILGLIMAVTGVAGAGAGPAQSAAVGDATDGRGGTPIAAFSMMVDVGVIIGPLVSGWLADHFGLPTGFIVGGIIVLLSSLFALRMPPGSPATSATT